MGRQHIFPHLTARVTTASPVQRTNEIKLMKDIHAQNLRISEVRFDPPSSGKRNKQTNKHISKCLTMSGNICL